VATISGSSRRTTWRSGPTPSRRSAASTRRSEPRRTVTLRPASRGTPLVRAPLAKVEHRRPVARGLLAPALQLDAAPIASIANVSAGRGSSRPRLLLRFSPSCCRRAAGVGALALLACGSRTSWVPVGRRRRAPTQPPRA
jgi:hypothetical protein